MRPALAPPPARGGVRFLYERRLGGLFLRLLSARWVSRLAGVFLDSKLSRSRIRKFVKKHGIDLNEYLPEKYSSFNAFFTRRIRPERRPFDFSPEALCSPCDGAVTVCPVTETGTFFVKGFDYTVFSLLKNDALARKFLGGECMIFRLTVHDYHRYHFFDGGTRGESGFVKGKLHTVQPAALGKRRVFTENCRAYTVLRTHSFGEVCQVEVGAMFVGRIVNEDKPEFSRGEEKGRFEFGGSTVILLFPAGTARLDAEFYENTAAGKETLVKCGERIGTCLLREKEEKNGQNGQNDAKNSEKRK